MTSSPRVVLTGGPGAGKTALLTALASRGFHVVPEVARAVIVERRAAGLPPRPEPLAFAKEILARDRGNHANAPAGPRPTFFDRGVVDALGMLAAQGALSDEERDHLLAAHPYHRTVFNLPPWAAIYRRDDERDQTFAEAVAVHDRLRAWYSACGYTVVDVPFASIDERANFVLRRLRTDLEAPR